MPQSISLLGNWLSNSCTLRNLTTNLAHVLLSYLYPRKDLFLLSKFLAVTPGQRQLLILLFSLHVEKEKPLFRSHVFITDFLRLLTLTSCWGS